MDRVLLIILRAKIESLERLFGVGFYSAAEVRAEATRLLEVMDIPEEERARLEMLSSAVNGPSGKSS